MTSRIELDKRVLPVSADVTADARTRDSDSPAPVGVVGGRLQPTAARVSVLPDVRREALVDALIAGLARLIDGQRRMADELGISYSHTFSYDFTPFAGRDVQTALQEHVRTQPIEIALTQLQKMFEDLSLHQVALLSAMDIVARRAIKFLSPALTPGGERATNQLLPVWKHYCERHERMREDVKARYQLLIAPGLLKGYVHARKKFGREK